MLKAVATLFICYIVWMLTKSVENSLLPWLAQQNEFPYIFWQVFFESINFTIVKVFTILTAIVAIQELV